jgi:hypothetical protein
VASRYGRSDVNDRGGSSCDSFPQAPAPGSNVRASVKSEGQELKVVVASDILSEGFDFGPQPLAVLRLDAVGGTGRFI